MDHIEILRETIKYLRVMIELREHELAALNNLLTKAGEMEFNLRFPEPPTPGDEK